MDRRYAKRMEIYWGLQYRMAIATLDHVNFDSWFDLWHTHVDWKCKGGRFLEQRRRAATLTFDAYRHAMERARSRVEPMQMWAHFFDDTGSNAVYVHTANPNGTPFPFAFEDTEWGVAKPPELVHLTLADKLELGRMQFQGEVSYLIRERA